MVLKHLEQWAHLLYPKLPFEFVIEQLATLGPKRAVKTSIKLLCNDTASIGQAKLDNIMDDIDAPRDVSTVFSVWVRQVNFGWKR